LISCTKDSNLANIAKTDGQSVEEEEEEEETCIGKNGVINLWGNGFRNSAILFFFIIMLKIKVYVCLTERRKEQKEKKPLLEKK